MLCAASMMLRIPSRGTRCSAPFDEVSFLATEALLGAFEVVMSERIEETFDRELLRSPGTQGRSRGRRR